MSGLLGFALLCAVSLLFIVARLVSRIHALNDQVSKLETALNNSRRAFTAYRMDVLR